MESFKGFLKEGGAFGHLSHPFDVNFSKAQLIRIVRNSLELKFDYPEIKTDAINLMVSVKNGTVISARNRGHLLNFGEKAMSIKDIAAKFRGRSIGVAYERAMEDFQQAVNKLSSAQVKKIFDEGRHWMSIEVMGQGAQNIIDYGGISEIRLHGTIEHNEKGEKVAQINKESARMFDGMLRQIQADRQKHFHIRRLTPAQFKPIANVNKIKADIVIQLNSVMGRAKTVDDYKTAELKKHFKTRDPELIDTLVNRYINRDKSQTITTIYKNYPQDKQWIQQLDKNIGPIMKNIMIPIEHVFLRLGSIVVGALNVFMALDPKETAKDLHNKLKQAVDLIKTKGSEGDIKKLEMELARLKAAGYDGTASSIPAEEGITFFVGDQFVKLTGKFAPINAIIGAIYQMQEE